MTVPTYLSDVFRTRFAGLMFCHLTESSISILPLRRLIDFHVLEPFPSTITGGASVCVTDRFIEQALCCLAAEDDQELWDRSATARWGHSTTRGPAAG